ncbi:Transcriptional regulator, MerR family protein [Enhygromyxa salina]|uniref:Transcriptional regulator, MerR family protein n=1 Tax=Enhygromyxa salina TaxID=215803 RepID=A0A0C1ZMM7_9BACT|nr:MerR family transcriptional regulator [Enhygromyxa salina]KIG12283.1 Transcriptional regulator, MerR family protein [Enhygromyxa salina]
MSDASKPAGKATAGRSKRTESGKAGSLELGTDKLYFKIGEVAEIVDVAAHVLRYWESEFSLIKPQKSRSQQRVYRRKDVENLLRIKHLLYARKFTIAGARQELRGGTSKIERAPVAGLYLARRSLADVREQIDQLAAVVRAEPEPADLAADPAQFVRDQASLGDGATTPEQQLLKRPNRRPAQDPSS